MSDHYNDDRPGMMRCHVAAMRGDLAAKHHAMSNLRAWAKAHGSGDFRSGSLSKRDFAWYMAQDGLIDTNGNLRDGFPEVAS